MGTGQESSSLCKDTLEWPLTGAAEKQSEVGWGVGMHPECLCPMQRKTFKKIPVMSLLQMGLLVYPLNTFLLSWRTV